MYDKSGVIVEDKFSVNDVTNTDPYPRWSETQNVTARIDWCSLFVRILS